jgi:hypothetical protein
MPSEDTVRALTVSQSKEKKPALTEPFSHEGDPAEAAPARLDEILILPSVQVK